MKKRFCIYAGVVSGLLVIVLLMAHWKNNNALCEVQNAIDTMEQSKNITENEIKDLKRKYEKLSDVQRSYIKNEEEIEYREAILLKNEKQWENAYNNLEKIGSYKDSERWKINICYNWAEDLQENGDLEGAIEVAMKISDISSRNALIKRIIYSEFEKFIKQENYQEACKALEVMEKLNVPNSVVGAYIGDLYKKTDIENTDFVTEVEMYIRKNIEYFNQYDLETGELLCNIHAKDENALVIEFLQDYKKINAGTYVAKFQDSQLSTSEFNNNVSLSYTWDYDIPNLARIRIRNNITGNGVNNLWIDIIGQQTIELGTSKRAEGIKQRRLDEAAKKPKEPRIGMTAEEVKKSTWGEPKSINKNTYEWGVHEQWVYSDYNYIYLEDGIVTAIQEHE